MNLIEAMARGIYLQQYGMHYGGPDRPLPCDPNGCNPSLHEYHSTFFAWQEFEDQARAALTAAEAAGWKMVPVVATEEMLRAADAAPARYSDLWSAMLSASPTIGGSDD